MKFIKNTEDYIKIPDGYEQKFAHEPFASTSLSAMVSYKESGIIENKDIKILDFIYTFSFVTYEQLERFCTQNNINELDGRLETLYTSVAINKMFLVDIERYQGPIPSNSKVFYCLADGGRQLLERFGDRNYINWEQGSNLCSSRTIGKNVLDAEIYLRMNEVGKELTNYEKKPLYNFRGTPLSVEGVFRFKNGSGSDYIITDIIRKNERIDEVRDKIRKYESLLCTNIWKKYYPDAIRQPLLLIITDNEEEALNYSREITQTTKMEVFLISTDDRIRMGIDVEGSVMQYDKNDDCLYETKYEF